MAGSLIFGLYYHYVALSADHVSQLPLGAAQGLFRLTALLLVAAETFGLVVGLFGLQVRRIDEVASCITERKKGSGVFSGCLPRGERGFKTFFEQENVLSDSD
jgi:hypothetical protein